MEPVKKRKLYHEVIDRLITAISTSEFPPGSQLPSERDLMAMIGVGRPSIREAMLSLQQMGLIQISHGERARVVRPTPDLIINQISAAMVLLLATNPRGLEELKDARVMIETGLTKIAASRATPHHIRDLENNLKNLRASRGNHAKFVATDMEFHSIIARMSGNSLVAAAVSGMLDWLKEFRRDMVALKGAEKLTIREHARIIKEIRNGDAAAASKAMHDHLTRANALYSKIDSPAAPT